MRELIGGLIGGYATGTLTRTEKQKLMRAALEDPELFAELVEEDDLREALEDESFRQSLLGRLRESLPDAGTRRQEEFGVRFFLTRLFRTPWLTAAGLAAAMLVVLLIRQGLLPESSPLAQVVLGPGTMPALHTAGILATPGESEREFAVTSRAEPPVPARDATLALDRPGKEPEYRIGDRQRIGFRLASPGNALLIEDRADGTAVRLFPNRYQSSPEVKAGETILVPPAGQGDLEVEAPAGHRRLRLLIFPPGVDPLAPGANPAQLRAQSRQAEKDYTIR
jgi:hypothetical protein